MDVMRPRRPKNHRRTLVVQDDYAFVLVQDVRRGRRQVVGHSSGIKMFGRSALEMAQVLGGIDLIARFKAWK